MTIRAALVFLFSLSSFQVFSQSNACQKAERLVAKLKQHHIRPLTVNDDWSKRVFENFFATLDPSRIYFTQGDIQQLQAQSTTLDDLILNQKPCAIVDVVGQLFKKKIQEYDVWREKNLTKPFNYNEQESFDALRAHLQTFASTKSDLEIRWKKYLKYQILSRIHQESLADSLRRPLMMYEKNAREKINMRERENSNELLKVKGDYENHITHSFLQSIASSYDPHTAYYSHEEAEEFKTALSMNQLSFGFSLMDDAMGTIQLSSIVPGSPAWNSNELHEGDILITIETPGNPTMNVMDYSIEELSDWLNDASIQEATFTIKKTDGQIKHVTLIKQKIESIENTVSGIVLKGPKKVGYISLPSFYFDWNKSATDGCANDVAKAIIKLNTEKIQGLILDLRFNGGGSLSEALGLAGIFIDFGPFATCSEVGQPLVTLRDQNKGTIYSGPLIIMVNGFSASASELLAATLQDYNRALIVGSQTFGKATGQEIFPMSIPAKTNDDHVKITELRLYRVTGKTYQHSGVIPQIPLYDMTDVFDLRESTLAYALPSDSISKKLFYTPLTSLPVTVLREKSNARISVSEAFKELEDVRRALSFPVPIDLKGFSDYLLKLKEPTLDQPSQFKASNTNFDSRMLAVDSFQKRLNDSLLSMIEKSVYIQETYSIMIDYLNLQKK